MNRMEAILLAAALLLAPWIAAAREPQATGVHPMIIAQKESKNMSTTIAIEGMVCSGCVNSVTKALKSAPGVTKVDVQLKPGKAVIEHDPSKIKPEELVRVVNETGYTARLGEPAAASGAAGSAPAK